MFSDLAIDVDYQLAGQPKKAHRLYVKGETALGWVKDAAELAFARGGGHVDRRGSRPNQPIPLAGFDSWAGGWNRLTTSRNQTVYFQIGGRIIKKLAQGGRPGGFADGFYVTDNAFSGTDTIPDGKGGRKPRDGTIWAREHGASYRDFGNFLNKKDAESAIKGVEWSQRTASSLRMVLKGKTGGHAPGSMQRAVNHGAVQATDTESALPLLAAAMFLAEPARNKRAWVVGLMLLDLIGAEYAKGTTTSHAKFFTLQRALVNPSRLIDPRQYGRPNYPKDPRWQGDTNDPVDQAPDAWVRRQARGNQRDIQSMGRPGSAAVEGLYPPSPKWSGRTSDNVDVARDYIQQKEVSVVCRWLEQEFNAYCGSDGTVVARAIEPQERGRRADAVVRDVPGESPMRGFANDLTRILKAELIEKRALSFNTPGVLFR